MKVSLVVTTYNWKEALAAVLASVSRQTRLPDEVIVADDGSTEDTAELLTELAKTFPVPLLHSWQPDQGFRVARSRNRAIAASTGDYVILVDGDMVLHPRFVADHMAAAAPGGFVQGSRVMTDSQFRDAMLEQPGMRPAFFAPGISKARNGVRASFLARAWLALNPRTTPHAIKSCNQGWWRSDLIRINGFDERIEGWGREDVELAWRAHFAGLSCRQLRYAGLGFHLEHNLRHGENMSRNNHFVMETKAKRSIRCARGIDQHLAARAFLPLTRLGEVDLSQHSVAQANAADRKSVV